MKARIYSSAIALSLTCIVTLWGRLINMLPVSKWAQAPIFFFVPALAAFAWPRKAEGQ
jgi:hypothetical protein